MNERLITPKELAEMIGTTTSRLAQDRYKGVGPKFVKYGRLVRYRDADIREWIEANTFTRTA